MSKPVIMCVEDQPEVLSALTKDIDVFTEAFDIVECDSGQDALDELEELDADGIPIALIISDCVMPGMSGVDLVKETRKNHKDIPIIVISGGGYEIGCKLAKDGLVSTCFPKPFQSRNLLNMVQVQEHQSHCLLHQKHMQFFLEKFMLHLTM